MLHDSVNPVTVGVKTVETEFIQRMQGNQGEAGQPGGKPNDINGSDAFVFPEVAKGEA